MFWFFRGIRYFAFLVIGVSVLLIFWFFTFPSEKKDKKKLYVLSTTSIINDLVRHIAKEEVKAESLMGAGIDPHLYQASESDVMKLASADIIFYNGLSLEAKLETLLKNMAKKRGVYAVSEKISKQQIIKATVGGYAYDPHIWFDVALWKQAASLVMEKLSEVDSARAGAYRSNFSEYLMQLEGLEEALGIRLQGIPEEKRILVTSHDAFSYFARAYNFKLYALQGINTAAQAGVKDLQKLVNLIYKNRIPFIFTEASTPKRNILAVQEAVEARGFPVEIGGTLFTDALGAANEYKMIASNKQVNVGTYIGMMQYNLSLLYQLRD